MQDTITKPLLKWYGENKRVLPWREKKNPYEIWVSEIMLQQTRVEAVKPFYERFMRELPNVAALAVCPEEKLLKLWEYFVTITVCGICRILHRKLWKCMTVYFRQITKP